MKKFSKIKNLHIHMKRLLFVTIVLLNYGITQSQYLAAYEDEQKNFWAFEAGMFNQLEESEILNFQVGGTLIAYLDGASNFKIYQYGKVQTLIEVAQVEFKATDYLLGYSLFDTLYVYEDEKITKLSTDCEEHLIRDSLIVWRTRTDGTLKVYYNGGITTIAEGLTNFKFERHMAGDNLFAFVNPYSKEFTVFYMGDIYILDSYAEQMIFRAGCDILAYTDVRDQVFNVFYRGEIIEIDRYQPQTFQVGDQILAYIDNQKDLKFFENGEIKNITSEPDFFEIKDHVFVYEEQGSFKTVCKGQIYIVEQYIPQPYYLDVNTISYLEHNESIRVFQHCNHVVANKVDVVKFDMVRNIIVYSENDDETKIYFNGEVFENK